MQIFFCRYQQKYKYIVHIKCETAVSEMAVSQLWNIVLQKVVGKKCKIPQKVVGKSVRNNQKSWEKV